MCHISANYNWWVRDNSTIAAHQVVILVMAVGGGPIGVLVVVAAVVVVLVVVGTEQTSRFVLYCDIPNIVLILYTNFECSL